TDRTDDGAQFIDGAMQDGQLGRYGHGRSPVDVLTDENPAPSLVERPYVAKRNTVLYCRGVALRSRSSRGNDSRPIRVSCLAVCAVLSTKREQVRKAPLAQSAERLHGKEKVYGSIP